MIDSPTLRRRRFIASLGAGALAGLGAGVARAQAAWPGKPVRIIVPFTPGTGMDILARTLAPHLQAAWGQGIVVDNRPGASGNLGAGAVAKSAPDGLTLLMGVNTLIINPALYSNMTYDPLKDLAPIGLCATGSFLLVAGAGAGIKSVDDLVKQARAKPGKLDYASPGIATPHHMAMELFKLRAKVSITHIPVLGDRRRGQRRAVGRRAADVPARARGDGAGQGRPPRRPRCRGRPPLDAGARRADARRAGLSRTSRPTSGTACSRRPERRATSSSASTPT